MKFIVFSLHAIEKIEILRNHNITIDKKFIENAVVNPEKVESGYKGRTIAQTKLDEEHVLHIVYEEGEDNLRIITMYPGRKKRYEKD